MDTVTTFVDGGGLDNAFTPIELLVYTVILVKTYRYAWYPYTEMGYS